MEITDFSRVYIQYYQKSFLFVKSYVRDDMATEDIVSESLLGFWNVVRRESVEYPLALLTTILKNNALNYLRHQEIKQMAIDTISTKMIHDLNYRISTLQACDPKEIFSAEILEIVERTLSSLPEQTRLIFDMSRNRYMSVKEISEKLNISQKTVEYHITKTLKILRVALIDYLPFIYLLMGSFPKA